MKTILVGYDGSEAAERALARAAELAEALAARIVVVSVFGLGGLPALDPESMPPLPPGGRAARGRGRARGRPDHRREPRARLPRATARASGRGGGRAARRARRPARPLRLALAGDTMLRRRVADAITAEGPDALVADEVVAVAREADLFVLNLECCISERGERRRDPGKPFFFRAPPAAIRLLQTLGVDCVTLANNHALDYGVEALVDTLAHLRAAGIAYVGAGPDLAAARAPVTLQADGLRVAVLGCADHPQDYAAGPATPGIAYGLDWVGYAVAKLEADAVLVTPHWGPNMTSEPLPRIRRAAAGLRAAGATLVAGHSAHVFHGVADRILYDLGDFLDDYAVHRELRNDLGLLFLAELDRAGLVRLEAVPLRLGFCHKRLAHGADAAWIRNRFVEACRDLGTEATEEQGRLVVSWRGGGERSPSPGASGACGRRS